MARVRGNSALNLAKSNVYRVRSSPNNSHARHAASHSASSARSVSSQKNSQIANSNLAAKAKPVQKSAQKPVQKSVPNNTGAVRERTVQNAAAKNNAVIYTDPKQKKRAAPLVRNEVKAVPLKNNQTVVKNASGNYSKENTSKKPYISTLSQNTGHVSAGAKRSMVASYSVYERESGRHAERQNIHGKNETKTVSWKTRQSAASGNVTPEKNVLVEKSDIKNTGDGKIASHGGRSGKFGGEIKQGGLVDELVLNPAKQLIMGNYYKGESTLAGTALEIGAGFTGADLPMDVRDLVYDVTHFELSWNYAGRLALDTVALLPVVGALKHADEAVDSVSSIAKKSGGFAEDAGSAANKSKRPSWKASENTVGERLDGYNSQVSFLEGGCENVSYGTSGSVRPDFHKKIELADGTTIHRTVEVKNYNIETSSGRSNLVRNTVKQYEQRLKHLPAGTEQSVWIDVRGQAYTDEILSGIADEILEKTKNNMIVDFMLY